MEPRRSTRLQNRRLLDNEQQIQQDADSVQEQSFQRGRGRPRGTSREIGRQRNPSMNIIQEPNLPVRGRPWNQPPNLDQELDLPQRGRPWNQPPNLDQEFDLPQRGRLRNEPVDQQPPRRRAANSPTFLNVRNQQFNEEQFKFDFKRYQEDLISQECNICNRKFYDVIIMPGKDRCEDCLKCIESNKPNRFTAENKMDPGPQPEIFKRLTLVEEMLIAQVLSIVCVYKIQNNQYGYSGHVINFPQDISTVAQTLPHSIEVLSKFVVLRRGCADGYADFFVDKEKVLQCLQWLKTNNPYYQNIEINYNNLENLPPQPASIFDQLSASQQQRRSQHQELGFEQSEEEADGEVTESGAPNLFIRNNQRQVNRILGILEENQENLDDLALGIRIENDQDLDNQPVQWPRIGSQPINEFTEQGYIVRSMPKLFPYGLADFKESRNHTVKLPEYFRHLIRYKDGRFAQHPRFRFFAMNTVLRHAALKNGGICLRKCPELRNIENIDQLNEYARNHPQCFRKILAYNQNLRSTSAYWFTRSRELIDMVKILGPPTIFLTFSAADIYWPETARILGDDLQMYERLNPPQRLKRRQRLLNTNPMPAAYFFHEIAKYFINHYIIPKYKVKDYWYRVEFQHRGSPHIHGLYWLENAPSIAVTPQQHQALEQLRIFFDNLAKASVPNPGGQRFDAADHPCTKHRADVPEADKETDLNNCVRAVQMHRCTKGYCQRRLRNSNTLTCRFKYPKTNQPQSTVEFDEHNKLVFKPQRNEPFLNPFNPDILQHWRANMDIQPITSLDNVINYIAKYASKAESRSKALIDLTRQALQNSTESSSVRQVIQRVLMKMVSERDYSAQEIFYVLNDWKLYRCSRQFTTIHLDDNSFVFVELDYQNNRLNRRDKFREYEQRDQNLFGNMSLYDFYALTSPKTGGGRSIRTRALPIIVRIKPTLQFDREGDNEGFFKQKTVVFVPFVNFEQLQREKGQSRWQEFYFRKLPTLDGSRPSGQITRMDELNLEQLVANVNADDDEFEGPDEEEPPVRNEAEMISALHPNQIPPVIPLGYREMDEIEDWNQSYQVYVNEDMSENDLIKFISTHKEQENLNLPPEQIEIDPLDLTEDNLSSDQKEVMNILHDQIRHLKGNRVNNLKNTVCIQGKAGSGKSTIIKLMTTILTREFPNHKVFSLMAPTGAAAVNIKGVTLHSKLSIGIKYELPNLSLETLARYQSDFEHINFVIIDEYSMVGGNLLKKINDRLKEFKSNNQVFGGTFVYLFGDMNQLPPVKDVALYRQTVSNPDAAVGVALFQNFDAFVFLRTSFRQSGNNNDQNQFRNILDNIGNGCIQNQDFTKLMERTINKLAFEDRRRFDDDTTVRLFPTNNMVKEYNESRLRRMPTAVAAILSINTPASAKSVLACSANGLESTLLLTQGCRVMLRSNLWTSQGLVNGALGYVRDIVYSPECRPPTSLPVVIMVEFDYYTGPSINGLVPIPTTKATFNMSSQQCTRIQFPLQIAFATSVHKSQGLTLDRVVFDIGDKETSLGLTYVALSRVKTWSGFAFLTGYNWDRFAKINNHPAFRDRKQFLRNIQDKCIPTLPTEYRSMLN